MEYSTEAYAWRILRQDNDEELMSGIVAELDDNIYPAQEEHYLTEEFPSLPYEVEMCKFKVEGLKLEYFEFQMTWSQLLQFKVK